MVPDLRCVCKYFHYVSVNIPKSRMTNHSSETLLIPGIWDTEFSSQRHKWLSELDQADICGSGLLCYSVAKDKSNCVEPSPSEGASIRSVAFHPLTLQRRGRANFDGKDDPVYPGVGVILDSWSYRTVFVVQLAVWGTVEEKQVTLSLSDV